MSKDKKIFQFAVGKRKEAVARLRLYTDLKSEPKINGVKIEKGSVFVNSKPIENYFSGLVSKAIYEEPLKITNNLGKYAITVKLKGGGLKSQLEAYVHALSKALSLLDEKNRHILKKKGFLTRDSRVKERRKVGMGGKARRLKQSPKR
jgi:small subunit ribosomal protein S9